MTEYKIDRVDVVQNPCTQLLQPMLYFTADIDFKNYANQNNNLIRVDVEDTQYYTGKGIFAKVDESSLLPNCRPNFSAVTNYSVLVLQIPWCNHPQKLGTFKLNKGVIAPPSVHKGVKENFEVYSPSNLVKENFEKKKADDLQVVTGGKTCPSSFNGVALGLLIAVIVLFCLLVFFGVFSFIKKRKHFD